MTTLVTFTLDRSGSMAACLDATIEAFNAYIDGLKGQDINFSLIQFDGQGIDIFYRNSPIDKVRPLDRETFVPRGSTPLIDAAYKAIKATEKRLSEMPADTKVVICIQTDGQENASIQYTWEELNLLIKEKTEAGWQFNFMGVGIDAYQQAQRMGLGIGQTVSYDATNVGATRAAFAASGANTRLYASGARGSTEYSAEQKLASGDTWEDAFKKMDAAGGLAGKTVKPPTAGHTARKPGEAVSDIDL